MGLEQGPWQNSKKLAREGKKNHGKNFRECGLMPKVETHTLMFFVCARVYVCGCGCALRFLCLNGHIYGF